MADHGPAQRGRGGGRGQGRANRDAYHEQQARAAERDQPAQAPAQPAQHDNRNANARGRGRGGQRGRTADNLRVPNNDANRYRRQRPPQNDQPQPAATTVARQPPPAGPLDALVNALVASHDEEDPIVTPESAPVLPPKQPNPHATMAENRRAAEYFVYKRAMYHRQKLMLVGGNPMRAVALGVSTTDFHSCNPVLTSKDVFRAIDRAAVNKQRLANGLPPFSTCEHRGEECQCFNADAAVFTDVHYYLTADQMAAVFARTTTRGGFVIGHTFSGEAGRKGVTKNGVEATWTRDADNNIAMVVAGDAVPYVHKDVQAVGSWMHGDGTTVMVNGARLYMYWSAETTFGDLTLWRFTLTERNVVTHLPAPPANAVATSFIVHVSEPVLRLPYYNVALISRTVPVRHVVLNSVLHRLTQQISGRTRDAITHNTLRTTAVTLLAEAAKMYPGNPGVMTDPAALATYVLGLRAEADNGLMTADARLNGTTYADLNERLRAIGVKQAANDTVKHSVLSATAGFVVGLGRYRTVVPAWVAVAAISAYKRQAPPTAPTVAALAGSALGFVVRPILRALVPGAVVAAIGQPAAPDSPPRYPVMQAVIDQAAAHGARVARVTEDTVCRVSAALSHPLPTADIVPEGYFDRVKDYVSGQFRAPSDLPLDTIMAVLQARLAHAAIRANPLTYASMVVISPVVEEALTHFLPHGWAVRALILGTELGSTLLSMRRAGLDWPHAAAAAFAQYSMTAIMHVVCQHMPFLPALLSHAAFNYAIVNDVIMDLVAWMGGGDLVQYVTPVTTASLKLTAMFVVALLAAAIWYMVDDAPVPPRPATLSYCATPTDGGKPLPPIPDGVEYWDGEMIAPAKYDLTVARCPPPNIGTRAAGTFIDDPVWWPRASQACSCNSASAVISRQFISDPTACVDTRGRPATADLVPYANPYCMYYVTVAGLTLATLLPGGRTDTVITPLSFAEWLSAFPKARRDILADAATTLPAPLGTGGPGATPLTADDAKVDTFVKKENILNVEPGATAAVRYDPVTRWERYVYGKEPLLVSGGPTTPFAPRNISTNRPRYQCATGPGTKAYTHALATQLAPYHPVSSEASALPWPFDGRLRSKIVSPFHPSRERTYQYLGAPAYLGRIVYDSGHAPEVIGQWAEDATDACRAIIASAIRSHVASRDAAITMRADAVERYFANPSKRYLPELDPNVRTEPIPTRNEGEPNGNFMNRLRKFAREGLPARCTAAPYDKEWEVGYLLIDYSKFDGTTSAPLLRWQNRVVTAAFSSKDDIANAGAMHVSKDWKAAFANALAMHEEYVGVTTEGAKFSRTGSRHSGDGITSAGNTIVNIGCIVAAMHALADAQLKAAGADPVAHMPSDMPAITNAGIQVDDFTMRTTIDLSARHLLEALLVNRDHVEHSSMLTDRGECPFGGSSSSVEFLSRFTTSKDGDTVPAVPKTAPPRVLSYPKASPNGTNGGLPDMTVVRLIFDSVHMLVRGDDSVVVGPRCVLEALRELMEGTNHGWRDTDDQQSWCGLKVKANIVYDLDLVEYCSAYFWNADGPKGPTRVLGPHPGRTLAKTFWCKHPIPPNLMDGFARAVARGLRDDTSHIPVTRIVVDALLRATDTRQNDAAEARLRKDPRYARDLAGRDSRVTHVAGRHTANADTYDQFFKIYGVDALATEQEVAEQLSGPLPWGIRAEGTGVEAMLNAELR